MDYDSTDHYSAAIDKSYPAPQYSGRERELGEAVLKNLGTVDREAGGQLQRMDMRDAQDQEDYFRLKGIMK